MRVLDCGAGFGNWACAMAEYFESSQVCYKSIAISMLAAHHGHDSADEAHRLVPRTKSTTGGNGLEAAF